MVTERDRINIIRTTENKALAKGRAEGAQQKSLEIAKNLLATGLSVEIIASCTDLTEAEVKSLQQN